VYALGMIFFELFYPFATEMERISTLSNVRKLEFPSRFTRELLEEVGPLTAQFDVMRFFNIYACVILCPWEECIWLIFVQLLYPYSKTSYIIACLFYCINDR